MKKRCSKCKYKDTDKIQDPKTKEFVDLTQTIKCYRADAPDVELCPKCKAVL